MRIGYVVAPDGDAANAIRTVQPQWSVGALAIAVVAALAPSSDLCTWATTTRRLRGHLVDELRARHLDVDDTDACWVLVRRDRLRDELAPHGVLVRDCTNFGLPGVSRVAVPDEAGRERLLAALDLVLG